MYIKYFAPIDEKRITTLLSLIEQKMKEGNLSFSILISSPGGNVHFGLSAYNFLKGAPIDLETHNFGSIDSIATVLYCAGRRRWCVPHARFLIHGVTMGIQPGLQLEEKQIDEILKSLRIDSENIAGVISQNTNKSEEVILAAMRERTTLNPEQAVEMGLVHEIREALYDAGNEIVSIQ